MENAGQDLVACLFQREDTLQDAAAVLSLSVADVTEAERMLRTLVNTASAEFTTKNQIDRCPLCGIALNENGVCPKCGYKK